MKRTFHLGIALLCLLTLVSTPAFCGHAVARTPSACAGSIPSSPAMPCCAAHLVNHAAQTAAIYEFSAAVPSALPLLLLPAASLYVSFRLPPVQASVSPGCFSPPLRI